MKKTFPFSHLKKFAVDFVTVFVVALAATMSVTYLWNLVGHGLSAADWETSIRFALVFAIVLTSSRALAAREMDSV